jgi:GntR family transcriptional regulator
MSAIDRSSPIPYYEQLYGELLRRIREGTIAPEDRLPSESQLHREFGLSRATVRQALEMLETNGWAVRVPRRGYFASAQPPEHGWLIEGQEGFLEDQLGHRNEQVRTKVVRARHLKLPEHAARALELNGPAEGFALERLRFMDDKVVLFSTNYSPPAVEPVVAASSGVLAGEASLTHALREGGFVAEGTRRVIHALQAPHSIAQHLEIDEGKPLLRIRSVTWGSTRVPFDYYETWLRSDRVPLELSTTVHRLVVAAPARSLS